MNPRRRKLVLGLLATLSGSAGAATWQKLHAPAAAANTWRKLPVAGGAAATWRKVLDRVVINLTAANVNNYNIFANRGGSYVAGKSDITLTITGTIGSASTGAYALDTGTGWTAGDTITIINNGTIIGCTGPASGVYGTGGAGGAGSKSSSIGPVAGSPGSPGGAGGQGGPAFRAQWPTKLYNNGTLYGGYGGAGGLGGGGGGGGGGATHSWSVTAYVGGAGGKGQGPAAAANGQPGQQTSYQSGGGQWFYATGGTGGRGGNYGAAGAQGGGSQIGGTTTGAFGGAAGATGASGAMGYYIVGNGNVTWMATGTRAGSVG